MKQAIEHKLGDFVYVVRNTIDDPDFGFVRGVEGKFLLIRHALIHRVPAHTVFSSLEDALTYQLSLCKGKYANKRNRVLNNLTRVQTMARIKAFSKPYRNQ